MPEQDAHQRGQHVAHRRERLHHPQGVRARPFGHHLGHQRHAHGELPAHAQPAQKAVEVEVPDAGGEHAQTREDGVAEDGHDHGLGAPQAVAQDAEEDPAEGPADHEDHGGVAGLLGDRGIGRSAAEQVADGRLAGEVEELLGHGVEHPAHDGDAQHEPVIAGEVLVPDVLGWPAGAPGEEPFRDMKLLFYIAAATRSPGFSGTSEGSATASPSASPSTTWISVTLEAPFFTGRRATVSPFSANT